MREINPETKAYKLQEVLKLGGLWSGSKEAYNCICDFEDIYLKQIAELQEKLAKYETIMQNNGEAITRREGIIKDQSAEILKKNEQLHRRNLQIADLKKRVKELETYNMTFGDSRNQ